MHARGTTPRRFDGTLRVPEEVTPTPAAQYHRRAADMPLVDVTLATRATDTVSAAQENRRAGEMFHAFSRGAGDREYEAPAALGAAAAGAVVRVDVTGVGAQRVEVAEVARLWRAALGPGGHRRDESAAIESERKRARLANYDPAAMGWAHRPTPLGTAGRWSNWRVPQIAQFQQATGTVPVSGPFSA